MLFTTFTFKNGRTARIFFLLQITSNLNCFGPGDNLRHAHLLSVLAFGSVKKLTTSLSSGAQGCLIWPSLKIDLGASPPRCRLLVDFYPKKSLSQPLEELHLGREVTPGGGAARKSFGPVDKDINTISKEMCFKLWNLRSLCLSSPCAYFNRIFIAAAHESLCLPPPIPSILTSDDTSRPPFSFCPIPIPSKHCHSTHYPGHQMLVFLSSHLHIYLSTVKLWVAHVTVPLLILGCHGKSPPDGIRFTALLAKLCYPF